MRVTFLLAATLVLLLGAAGAGHADNPVLTGDVGLDDAYTITLTSGGAKVTNLEPGTYTLVVHDHSSIHNFHLSGPGVDVSTTIDGVGDQTFTVTLAAGTYFYNCDPHAAQMKGSFTVGSAAAPPPPPPAPKPAPGKLAGSIGPGGQIALGPLGALAAGAFSITVRDRSATDGFRLAGPGVSRSTAAGFRGTVTWTVTLRAGRYTFGSSRSPKLRRAFAVSGS